jgi:hypothetical protein
VRDAAASLVGSVAYVVLAERWDNCAALRALTCPVLLLHGTADEVIPFRHGEQLAALRRRERLPVVFHAQEGGTHNVYRVREDYSEPIACALSAYCLGALAALTRCSLRAFLQRSHGRLDAPLMQLHAVRERRVPLSPAVKVEKATSCLPIFD